MIEEGLIQVSNIHIGGGIQVASSFLNELSSISNKRNKVSVKTSTEVDVALKKLHTKTENFDKYEVTNIYGFSIASFLSKCNSSKSFERIFTVFGPCYQLTNNHVEITGFAQAWIIYPNNECYKLLGPFSKIRTRLKYWIQAQFFKRADVLVVELEHVKQGLVRELGFAPERIHVVHNCISSIYLNESIWQDVNMPEAPCDLKLGFLGRNYIHKNTRIFPEIVSQLEQRYGIKARIYVTFTEAEWIACTPEFRTVCINVGELEVAQCPRFYNALDAVIFPSLLECFSATPLEAMAMEKPLFASDRPFNRDVCADHAHYFDPFSPKQAAAKIAKVFSDGGPIKEALGAARTHAINFSNPKDRAEKYLAIMMQATKKLKS